LKGDKEDAYYKKHSEAITAFTSAHNYLTRHLNGRTQIPLDAWKREIADLTTRRQVLLYDSDRLAAELRSAEASMRNAERDMGAKAEQQKRSHDIGL
jgi:cob(I)alamin adenosyltransferase